MSTFIGPLANGEHDLGFQNSSSVVVTVSGTGTGVLGFTDSTGTFQAYGDAGATLVSPAETLVTIGWRPRLMISVTGSSGNFVVGLSGV